MIKLLHVNSTLDLKKGGGLAERLYHLSKEIGGHPDFDCSVLTLDIIETNIHRANINFYETKLPVLSKRFHLPYFNIKKIYNFVKENDIILLMGHWTILNVIVYRAAIVYKKPYMICPGGSLPIFGRSKILKFIYNLIVGTSIIKNANAIIAITKDEAKDLSKYKTNKNKLLILPNGIEKKVPNKIIEVSNGLRDICRRPFILFMGRISPIKGPDLLVEAFALLIKKHKNISLIFAGPWEEQFLAKIKLRIKTYKLDCIFFIGHVESNERDYLYKKAKLLIIPSRREAMSLVALEAAKFKLPVLISNKAGFHEIKNLNPKVLFEPNVLGILKVLSYYLDNLDKLKEWGVLFNNFVDKTFLWEIIICDYKNLIYKVMKDKSK